MGGGGPLLYAGGTATYRDQLRKERRLIPGPPRQLTPLGNSPIPRPMASLSKIRQQQQFTPRATATLLSPRQPTLESLSARAMSNAVPYNTPLVRQGTNSYVESPMPFARLVEQCTASQTKSAMPLVPWELSSMNRVAPWA